MSYRERLAQLLTTIVGSVTERAINIVFALDCFLFSIVTIGGSHPFESFSSAAYRAESKGMAYGKARPWIDLVCGAKHCERAYNNAKTNLPEDQR